MPMHHAVDRSQPPIPEIHKSGIQNSGTPCSAPGTRPRGRGRLGAVAIGLLIASLTGGGCRSGVRSMTAPKWPSFGTAKPKGVDDSALAAKPKITASVDKPSTAATPYPTTSTPAGYVVNDASPTAGGPVPGIQTAATDPAAVTYGVTPPSQIAPPASQTPQALADATPPAAIPTQVGPYATLPPPPPAAEAPAPPGIPPSAAGLDSALPPPAQLTAAPPDGGYPIAPPATSSAFPSTAGYEPSRVADARGVAPSVASPEAPGSRFAAAGVAAGAAAATAPALVPINPQDAPQDPSQPNALPQESGTPARYASDRSRFGDPLAPPPPASSQPLAPPAATGWTGASEVPAAAALPAAPLVPAPFPAAPPAPLAPASPDGLTSPPVRRPDPVFRPGGTSSYRPAEQIFVDEQPVAPSAVRTASYEFTVPPPPPAGQD